MKKGFTLVEILIVILISSLMIGAMVGLFAVHQLVQSSTKATSDIMEIQRAGIAQLEWIFSRWGTGTPCYNYNFTNPVVCTRITSCRVENSFPYPPPSSMCITIESGVPCDEVWFYANLEGVGIVTNIFRDTAYLVSCRIKTDQENNCFHVIRYGKFFTDDRNETKILTFSLASLSEQDLECLDEKYLNPYEYNAEVDRNATILNEGTVDGKSWLLLEGGDIIVRAPKLVHLYCENDYNNVVWLKMDLSEMAENCTGEIKTIKISPVENFKVSMAGESIKVDITFRNFENQNSRNYKTYKVTRYFGR